MSSLYVADCIDLLTKQTSDVKRWSSIYKFIPSSISLVDRCNHLMMPYKFKTFEMFNMPRDLSDFDSSYEDCCFARAQELIDMSVRLSKPITVLYSGGIDSTTVLVSFMKILKPQELKEKIRVALSIESIQENVNFYYDHIRTKCTIVSSEYVSSMLDGTTILVSGEHNDQLFGSDIIGNIYRTGDYTNIHQKYDRRYITSWLETRLTKSEANYWYDVLNGHILSQAPCEVTTNFHFFWWYNFCFKWQNVYFRLLTRVDLDKRAVIDQNFLSDNYHHFFSSEDFQKWSMLNHHLKIGKDWTSYKLEAKKFIFDFNGDIVYRDSKIKSGSLYRLFLHKRTATGITDDFKFLETIDINEYYQPNNSFV